MQCFPRHVSTNSSVAPRRRIGVPLRGGGAAAAVWRWCCRCVVVVLPLHGGGAAAVLLQSLLLDCSVCCWIAGPRITYKACVFHRDRYQLALSSVTCGACRGSLGSFSEGSMMGGVFQTDPSHSTLAKCNPIRCNAPLRASMPGSHPPAALTLGGRKGLLAGPASPGGGAQRNRGWGGGGAACVTKSGLA